MLWIKRNLFLTVGGLIALVLLGAGIVYALGALNRNSTLNEELAQNNATLNRLYGQTPFPASTNIDAARREIEKFSSAVGRMKRFFSAPPIERVTGLAFRTYRDNLLAELRRSAEQARTKLPGSTYAFSFEEQRTRTEFDPRTFPLVAEQMSEVRAICNVLFEAHVDPLINVRRARVSENDELSSHQNDYHPYLIETNASTSAMMSPYEVSFLSLSADLANVLQRLAVSRYGLLVKSVSVEPLAEAGTVEGPGGVQRGQPNTGQRQPLPVPRPAPRPPAPRGTAVRPGAPAADRVTLLKERRFKVTLLIHVIRAADTPKSRR
jgi:hypothetical protein